MLIKFSRHVNEFAEHLNRKASISEIYQELGIDGSELEDPLAFISLRKAVLFLERASEALDRPWLGLEVALAFQPGGTGLLGQLMRNAPDARTAMHQLAATAPTFLFPFDAGFEETQGRGRLRWSFENTGVKISGEIQFSQFIAASAILRLQDGIGTDWVPLHVAFAHKQIPISPQARELFGPTIQFDACENGIAFSMPTLDRKMTGSDDTLYAVLKDLAKRWLQEARLFPPIVSEVRNEILSQLKAGPIDLENVARSLNVTPRLLQSRLEQVGTNFEKILNETRSELALQLLKETDLPVSEIAYDLGYSDPSVLTRAVRRWFDKSPSQIRQEARV